MIDPTGSVAWEARTTVVMKSGTWTVYLGGAPIRSGQIDNPEGKKIKGGVQDIAELPAWARIPDPVHAADRRQAAGPGRGGQRVDDLHRDGLDHRHRQHDRVTAFWMGAGVLLLAMLLLFLLFTTTTATTTGATAAGAGAGTMSGSGVR